MQQYAGRLHRLFADKREVQIYDYVDIHVSMLEKMYHKRLNGYASIGYKAKACAALADSIDIIFICRTVPVFGLLSRSTAVFCPFFSRC